MRPGDLIKIVQQPRNQQEKLVDVVAIIEGYSGINLAITAISLDGKPMGSGVVPMGCAAIETSKEWLEARNLFDKNYKRKKQ